MHKLLLHGHEVIKLFTISLDRVYITNRKNLMLLIKQLRLETSL